MWHHPMPHFPPWPPAAAAAQHSSPSTAPSPALRPALCRTTLSIFQPPGPAFPAKYSKPTSRCFWHQKPHLSKQETNISRSFLLLSFISGKREVQVLLPLNHAESRRGHPATAKAQVIFHFLNSMFSYSTASLSTPGACPTRG